MGTILAQCPSIRLERKDTVLETYLLRKIVILVSVFVVGNCLQAQGQTLQDTNTEAVIRYYSEHPDFQVQKDEQGGTLITPKGRTEPSKDPEDQEDKYKISTLQRMFNLGLALGGTQLNKDLFASAQAGSSTAEKNGTYFGMEFSVRPPARGLKRLSLGFTYALRNTQMSPPTGLYPQKVQSNGLAHDNHGDEKYTTIFTEWDALYIPAGEDMNFALTAGIYKGFVKADWPEVFQPKLGESYSWTDWGYTARLRLVIADTAPGYNIHPYIAIKYSKSGIHSGIIGMNFVFGRAMAVRRIKLK